MGIPSRILKVSFGGGVRGGYPAFFDGNDSCFLKVIPGEEFDFFGFGKEVDVTY